MTEAQTVHRGVIVGFRSTQVRTVDRASTDYREVRSYGGLLVSRARHSCISFEDSLMLRIGGD